MVAILDYIYRLLAVDKPFMTSPRPMTLLSFQSPQKNLLNKQGDAMKRQPTVAMGIGYTESNHITWYSLHFDSIRLAFQSPFFASYQNHRNGNSELSCLLFCNVQAILASSLKVL